MTRTRATLAVLAAAAAVAAAPASASAQQYEFRGNVAAVSGSSVIVQVANGNRPALRAMIGAPQPLTFPVGDRTHSTLQLPSIKAYAFTTGQCTLRNSSSNHQCRHDHH